MFKRNRYFLLKKKIYIKIPQVPNSGSRLYKEYRMKEEMRFEQSLANMTEEERRKVLHSCNWHLGVGSF